ncbi:S1/P1 nuclease [Vibrio nigripulchritudo]|uniref:S1/P1 nuclease n=1 Tax=Vibrio nigripulchritudo TaxID=28173 RepID=UPI0003B227AD|nr:S1/P1 nuclease [Vibrio nigripulchritudo]CCN73269.1 putative Aspergillus nuclease S(1) [Vibrio nigripulchritudo SFn118]
MNNKGITFIALAGCLLTSSASFAFGKYGHQVVCDVAWRAMSAKSQDQVAALLKDTRYPTFAEACVWADEVKSNPEFDRAKPHHYINVKKGAQNVELTQRCDDKGCVVSAIGEYKNILAGKPSGNPLYFNDKTKALMFLGHFVGDIHQPLHVSYAEDLGGNKVNITHDGKSSNLHRFFDSKLIDESDMTWLEYGEDLYNDLVAIDTQAWESFNTLDWANESYQITRQIYQELPEDGVISAEFEDKYQPILKNRIQQAGYRLAIVLDGILASRPVSEAQPDDKTDADSVELMGGSYYADAQGKTGAELHQALNLIIRDHEKLTYKQVYKALDYTDEDPFNTDNVILLYTQRSQSKTSKYKGGRNNDHWNREHVWAKSRGFPSKGQAAYTDLHHLRPADVTVNSSRGSKLFDDGGQDHGEVLGAHADNNSFEPPETVKGDVARMIFYMAVAYDGNTGGTPDLTLHRGSTAAKKPKFGHLCTLLEWHLNDQPSDWERRRNERIFELQGNRNPFIDVPSYADAIWGDRC